MNLRSIREAASHVGLAGVALLAFVSCETILGGENGLEVETPQRGAVVSEHREATLVGIDILERGGNAADAAVATAFALSVVYPQAGNVGGGGFALYVPHSGDPVAVDFRETTPAAYRPELYLDGNDKRVRVRSLEGPLAVGVPGSPAGLVYLKRKYGSSTLSLEQLVEPAIKLAYDGFPVDTVLADLLAAPETRGKLEGSPLARQLFYPDGEPLPAGSILKQPELARTLEKIADDGNSGFYQGPVARAVVAELDRTPVFGDASIRERMTLQDLKSYKVVERSPLRGWFRGMELLTMPPPSSGGVCLLQILTILEGFPLDGSREAALSGAEVRLDSETGTRVVQDGAGLSERATHWWIEAMRHSFADRAEHLGDSDFVDVPVGELLSREWIAQRRISIGESADPGVGAMPSRTESVQPPHTGGTETTHLSVIDSDGNAVSLTTTLNSWFGSGMLVAGGGFFLNNELDDFAIQAGSPNQFGLIGSEANALAPGKRPLSSMTPTVIRDDRRAVLMVLGSPGGPKIITSVVQVILRTLVLGQSLEAAVSAPRLHQQWVPAHTKFETGWDQDLLSTLQTNRDHEVEVSDSFFGSVQAILVEKGGRVIGVSDPRRGGVAGVEGKRVPYPVRKGRGAKRLREAEPVRGGKREPATVE